MKFVGRPDGKLMKHAPGNYIHGQEYMVPFNHAQWDFWELLEDKPVLVAPEPSGADDVFEETFFIPEEEETEVTLSAPIPEKAPVVEPQPEISIEETPPPTHDESVNIDPNAPATIEPYMMFNPGTGKIRIIDPEEFPEQKSKTNESVLLELEIIRLQKALDEAKATPSVKLEEVLEEPVEEAVPVEEPVGDTRDDLLDILKHAGVEVKPGTRTTTLRKMVDNLESQE